jgi:hypothetical protein
MSAIIITNPEKLREAIDFAMEAKCVDQLGIGLVRLFQTLTVGMTPDNRMVATVSSDFAPHSLNFAVFHDMGWQFVDGPSQRQLCLNGGWIYAGPGAPGDGSAPSFSVNLSWVAGQEPTHSWSVHT